MIKYTIDWDDTTHDGKVTKPAKRNVVTYDDGTGFEFMDFIAGELGMWLNDHLDGSYYNMIQIKSEHVKEGELDSVVVSENGKVIERTTLPIIAQYHADWVNGHSTEGSIQ